MKTLTRDHIRYSFDPSHPPALEIEPGETLLVETYDARTGTIRRDEDLLDHAHLDGANPATGPIAVTGAKPGDSLAVEILDIDLAPSGFVAVKQGIGLLADQAERFATRIVPIQDGAVIFSDEIRFPTRPMVGVVGTAPDGPAIETLYPGVHGGNMDNRFIAPGAAVHLPVFVEGAMLGLGDVHASMGDGEISMLGLEICAEVRVRVRLNSGVQIARPWIETPESWITTGDSPDAVQALRIAAEEMAMLLQTRLGLSFEDAYMLMSARADVQVCQICDPGNLPVTARAVFPRIEPR